MLFIYLSLSSVILQRDYGLSTNAFSAVFAVNSVGIITAGSSTIRLLRRFPPERLLAVGLGAALAGAAGLGAVVAAGAPIWAVLPFLFVCVASMGNIIPTATNLAMLNHPEAAGAGSALLGGAQYAVGGLAGPVVTLAGDTAAAMSIGMGIAAAGAVAAWHGIGRASPQRSSETPPQTSSVP
jgi:DHA1 family bicyclomycin/chloramphenicol resistance-like MFS transporter